MNWSAFVGAMTGANNPGEPEPSAAAAESKSEKKPQCPYCTLPKGHKPPCKAFVPTPGERAEVSEFGERFFPCWVCRGKGGDYEQACFDLPGEVMTTPCAACEGSGDGRVTRRNLRAPANEAATAESEER